MRKSTIAFDVAPAAKPVGKHRSGIVVLALSLGLSAAILSASGCGMQPGAATISYFKSHDPPPPTEALHTGIYYLYAFNSPNPLYSIRLTEGTPYGFRRAADGKIVAFAKDKEIPLETIATTSYEWRYRKN